MVRANNPVRQAWPDIAKGVGILLMSLGHSAIPPKWLGVWIYSFHMPLFFLLSGWFFTLKEDSPRKTMVHKAFPILMPMVSYGAAKWLWSALSALASGAPVDLRPLLGVALQWPGTGFAGAVWFFPGLFVGECLFALLLKALGRRPGLLVGCSFLLAAGTYAAVSLGMPRLPWHAGAACLLVPYLALGWWARRREQTLFGFAQRHLLPLVLALAALDLGLTALNLAFGPYHIDYNLRRLNEFFTCYAAGTAGVALCVLLCRRLPLCRPLAFLGEYSAVYYAVGWIGSNVAHHAVRAVWPVSGPALLCVHLAGMALVPVPLILFLKRFCPALMGKRKEP